MGRAEDIANRLPLVRVLLPLAKKNPDRFKSHFESVLGRGMIELDHESQKTREFEDSLGVDRGIYFHSARGDDTYGTVLFAFNDLGGALHATPFGLGGLDCDATTDVTCARTSCMPPVSHRAPEGKKRYVEPHTWKTEWRARAAVHLESYFECDGFIRYFERNALPCNPDPDGIWHAAQQNGKIDYRHFTVEVRLLGRLDLRAALRAGQIRFCCIPSEIKMMAERQQMEFYYDLLSSQLVNPPEFLDALEGRAKVSTDLIDMANQSLRAEALQP